MDRPPDLERLYEGDKLLREYESDILQRWQRFRDWESRVSEGEGGLAQFARAYADWGIVQRASGDVTVREWVENGAEVALVGDFNGWDRTRHVCTRDEYSVFSLTVPPLADGSPAVPHGSEVKLWIRTKFGQEIYRMSPWTKYATQVSRRGGAVTSQAACVFCAICRTCLCPRTTGPSTGLRPPPTSGSTLELPGRPV